MNKQIGSVSLLNALENLGEDEFTKEILVPLFRSLGYVHISFKGGPYEMGVDLIALKKMSYSVSLK